jgi:hypothetical protein
MKRNVYVVVRFSRQERAALRREALGAHASVSDYVRAKVLRGLSVERDEDPRQLPLYPKGGAFHRKR